ncbi:MAG: DUF1214 domain-containing protein [Bacillota bacterium]
MRTQMPKPLAIALIAITLMICVSCNRSKSAQAKERPTNEPPAKMSTGTPSEPHPEKLSGTETVAIATNAYIYGYPTIVKTLLDVPQAAQKKIMDHLKDTGTDINDWRYSTQTGVYGTDYLQRAFTTAIGLGGNRPQDAIYPTSEIDVEDNPYNGINEYVMYFDKGQMPLNGFWSLTMYDAHDFFASNFLNRDPLSQRDKSIENPDGSTNLYILHESPGKDRESNWGSRPQRQVHSHAPFLLVRGVRHQRHLGAARSETRRLNTDITQLTRAGIRGQTIPLV